MLPPLPLRSIRRPVHGLRPEAHAQSCTVPAMALLVEPQLALLAGAGVVGGLGMLVRGFGGYRRASEITDTAPSRISSIAVGEVLVSGVVEPGRADAGLAPSECQLCLLPVAGRQIGWEGHDERIPRGARGRLPDPRRQRQPRVFPTWPRSTCPRTSTTTAPCSSATASSRTSSTGSSFFPSPADRDSQIAALLTVHPPSGSLPTGGDNDGPEG